MGACFSSPASAAPSSLQKHEQNGIATPNGFAHGGLAGRTPPGQNRAGPAAAAAACDGAAPVAPFELIQKVHSLQQQLSLLSSHPLLALPEASELLAEQLGVDLVGIYAFAHERPGCAALMAAHGHGAAVLERAAVVRGGRWAAVRLQAQGQCRDGGWLLSEDASLAKEPAEPADFVALSQEAGMRGVAAVAIGPAGVAPLGALLLATRQPGLITPQWAALWTSAAATGLLQHVRPLQVALAARMLSTIDEVPDPVAAISVLLQSGTRFMWRATNVTMGVRLALLEDLGDAALVFESARAATCKEDPRSFLSGKTALLPSDPIADVTVREVPLDNTLLASVFALKKARFVKDCASYMQNCPTPARDVFTHSSHLVSSLVVVPLLVDDRALGALYFTQDTPCDFSNIQDALLGFVHCMTLTLHNKLSGQMERLKGMVEQANQQRKSFELLSERATNAHVIRQLDTSSSESDDDDDDGGDGAAAAASPAAADDDAPPLSSANGRLSKVSSRRLCTEAMLKVLQQEIRKGKRRSVELSFVGDHLVIGESIGRGGYGRVYRGSWHKRPAAIKVMNTRHNDSEAVSDAMEMAVLSSVQHPNIVQVYSCLTDMVEAPASCSSAQSLSSVATTGAQRALHYRRMLPEEDNETVPTYSIIVMEFMDRGTLGDAVRKARLFHQALESGSIGVDLASVIDVLLDVAHSLQYLHSISLLHGDVKLDNVLLKSDPLRPLGIVPKLADFGLTKIVRGDDQVVNHSGAGTVTHLAPEMFQAGTRVTTAVDVYAFGVLMWEFYTGRRPWQGLTRDAIIDRVMRRGARPHFPAGAPRAFVDLATACWATSPVDRPSSSDIVGALQAIADNMAEAAAQQWQGGGSSSGDYPPAACAQRPPPPPAAPRAPGAAPAAAPAAAARPPPAAAPPAAAARSAPGPARPAAAAAAPALAAASALYR